MISARTPRSQRVRRLAYLLVSLCLFIGSSTFGAAPRAIRAAAPQASARVFKLCAASDSTISLWAASNQGSQSYLNLAYRQPLNQPLDESRALLRFDLSALPPGARVDAATLQTWLPPPEDAQTATLSTTRPTIATPDPGLTVNVRPLLGGWAESTVTWEQEPTTGEVAGSTQARTAGGYSSWLLTPLVHSWLHEPSANYGLELRGPEETPGWTLSFSSREGSVPPRLVLNATVDISQLSAAPPPNGSPTLRIDPPAADAGDPVTIAGSGFTPGSQLSLFWDDSGANSALGQVTANLSGGFTLDTRVPDTVVMGQHVVLAFVSSPPPQALASIAAGLGPLLAQQPVTVESCEPAGFSFAPLAPSVILSPANGPSNGGNQVQVSGSGWAPNTQIQLFFDAVSACTTVTPGNCLGAVFADANGSFQRTVTIPAFALTDRSVNHIVVAQRGPLSRAPTAVAAAPYRMDLSPTGNPPNPTPLSRTVCATADTYVSQANPLNTYGSAATFGAGYRLGNQRVPEDVQVGLLQFDLSQFNTGTRVLQATLRANLTAASGAASVPLEAANVVGGWSEAGVSWNLAPQVGGTYATTAVGQAPGTVTWDVTTLAQSWIDGSLQNNGMAILSAGSSTADFNRSFRTREAGDPPCIDLSLSASPPLTDIDLTVDDIEVSQAIQVGPPSPGQRSVPLVANKPTGVRVYVNVGADRSAPVSGVTAVLRGRNRAGPLPEALTPLGGLITAQPGAWPGIYAAEAGDPSRTLNFILPPAWTATGELFLDVQLNPNQSVPERSYANNGTADYLRFALANPFDVLAIPTTIQDSRTNLSYSSQIDWANQTLDAVLAMYPLAEVRRWEVPGFNLAYRGDLRTTGTSGCGAGWDGLLDAIRDLRGDFNTPDSMRYFGMVSPLAPMNNRGCAYLGGSPDAVGKVTPRGVTSQTDGPHVAAQELAHTFGLAHAPDPCTGGGVDPGWPNDTNPNGTIGAFGLDLTSGFRVVPPGTSDLMGACDPAWVSPYTYGNLWQRGLGVGTTTMQTLEATQPLSDYLHLAGTIDGQHVQLSAPPLRVQRPAGSHDETGSGPYSLDLWSAEGQVLFHRQFTLHHAWDHDPSASLNVGHFAELLPYPAGLHRITIARDGQILLERTASAHVPQVTITAPAAGEDWGFSGQHTVSWIASDGDGDALTFRLDYSIDGGANWQPLTAWGDSTSVTVDAAELAGSHQVQFRVLASDGFNSAEAHSGTIAVADKAPHVHLAWPVAEQRVLADQLLFLRGLASDPEDGPLSDQALTWRVDGRLLARGGMVGTDALRPGSHQISLEARDAQGNLARAEVSITVVDTSGKRIYLPLVTMPK